MAEFSYGLRAEMLLARSGFRSVHSLGQNFLLDDRLLVHLLALAGVEKGDNVLEIGPGAGVMTCLLAERAGRLLSLEIDRQLAPVLSQMLAPFENVRVVYADAMKADLPALTKEAFFGEDYRVIANLPYYITADAITRLLLLSNAPKDICLMVQKEAAERIMSAPGEKKWGHLSALVQYFSAPEVLENVPARAFSPPPHVDSVFLRLRPYGAEKPVRPKDEALFLRVLQAAFFMRRKTLANNLKAVFSISADSARVILQKTGLDEQVRGEALNLNKLALLTDNLPAFL